ncbi:hypothetical protein [Roseovarius nitratireducens]|jgi:hypothetical protein|uniref:hypothetical protein n=1 Tax=Roseovarius nitratireducens TaxID=2044597 RepID=UPI000CE282D6|nr:hypothetical protein [Roseovarius nitratireducens]
MSQKVREKFATQVNTELLSAVRGLAKAEGRQLQALVDEALTDLIEKRKHERPRGHVIDAYRASRAKRETLYRKLAE